ncbi:MAG: c-type cytochrome [Nitrospirae bacterium]|nr:c-type cytochrome [Nitrospirota bacterium]
MKYLSSLIIVPMLLLPALAKAGPDPKEVFSSKCSKCHSMKLDKIDKKVSKAGKRAKGPDLSGVGLKYEEAWFSKWLSKEVEKDSLYQQGKKIKHKKNFKKEGEETLKAMATWLSQHKTKVEVSPEEEGAAEEEEEEKEE